MPYIDLEYYSSLYPDIPEKDFDRLNRIATGKLDVQTHMRSQDFFDTYDEEFATSFQKNVYMRIRHTMCDIVHALYEQENSDIGKGISSVSNDGYSESYKITTSEEQEEQIRMMIRAGLSGTGLAGAL